MTEVQMMAVARAVDDRWLHDHGAGDTEVLLGAVAALALLAGESAELDAAGAWVTGLGAVEFSGFVRRQWRTFLRARPDLAVSVYPLARHWAATPPEAADHARAAAVAGVAAGMLAVTGTAARYGTDMLGAVLGLSRTENARAKRGQYYTPADIADLTALLAGAPDDGARVYDPAVGTGGLWRSTAVAMRAHGRDPRTVEWTGVDIDATAVACAAVNAVTWGLGPNVVLAVGDALAGPAALDAARAQRHELATLARTARLVGVLDDLTRPCPDPDPPDTTSQGQQLALDLGIEGAA